MSRTRKGGKPPGFEFWSRRPSGGFSSGRVAKDVTKAKERMRQKDLIRKEKDDLK